MLFPVRMFDGLRDESITPTFRNWKRPQAKVDAAALRKELTWPPGKKLGLTESLEVGYRLSPRGRAYLDATR